MSICKLSVACCAVRAIRPFVTQYTLKKVYHSYCHSVINYRITFRENPSYSNSIFKLQKRNISIILGVGIRDSCRNFLKYKYFTTDFTAYIFSPTLCGY